MRVPDPVNENLSTLPRDARLWGLLTEMAYALPSSQERHRNERPESRAVERYSPPYDSKAVGPCVLSIIDAAADPSCHEVHS